MDNLDDLKLGGEHLVARASSERPKDLRWTVLSLYRHEGQYVAEIVGESRMPGEVRRQRRAGFPTLAAALGWDRWNVGSDLYRQLRQAVLEGIDERSSGAHVLNRPPVLLGTLEAGSGARLPDDPIARLIAGAKHAADQFADYGRQHRAKGTAEGDEKAERNEQRAAGLRALVVAAEEAHYARRR